MAEIEFAGLKFKGGKMVGVIIALSTLVGGLYGAFEVYKDYQDMKAKIQEYTAPDLAYIEQEIAVLKTEIDSVLDEVTIVADVAKELKNDLKADVRRIETIVEDVEQRVKEDSREQDKELKELREELELTIQKALNNPLNAIN
jgi:paraquat-inducible protein B